VRTVSSFVDEAIVSMSKDGINLVEMDPAHVAMIDFTMTNEAFDGYEINTKCQHCGSMVKGKTTDVEISFEAIDNLLKKARKDFITLTYDENADKKEQVKLTFTGKMSDRTFPIKPVEPKREEKLKTPDIKKNLHGMAEISSAELQKLVKDADSLADHLSIEINKNGFEMRTKTDNGTSVAKIPQKNCVQFKCKEKVGSFYSTGYFMDVFGKDKISEVFETVKIHIGTEMPAILEMEGSGIKCVIMIAPRIESGKE